MGGSRRRRSGAVGGWSVPRGGVGSLRESAGGGEAVAAVDRGVVGWSSEPGPAAAGPAEALAAARMVCGPSANGEAALPALLSGQKGHCRLGLLAVVWEVVAEKSTRNFP